MQNSFNKILLVLFFLFGTVTSIFSSNLKASFNYCTFYNPEKGPYIETYLSVVGESVNYVKTKKGDFQGKIEILLIFKQGEKIKKYKKYHLLSPVVKDTTGKESNFVDQQRILLPNGKYEFELQIKDVNSDDPPFNSTQIIKVDYPSKAMAISDIEFVESMKKTKEKSIISKSGYDLVPFVSNYFPPEMDKITFYSEIYNSSKYLGKNNKYLINYYIESSKDNEIIPGYKSFRREDASDVDIVLNQFNIEDLQSGNYYLVIEARNRENELLVRKKTYFQRNNPEVKPVFSKEDISNTFVKNLDDKEKLDEYIQSIQPVATPLERSFYKNQVKDAGLTLMQQYFFNFWTERYPEDPEEGWENYKTKVEKVDEHFGTTIKNGYETDRGRVYLQYGSPNTIMERKNEPSAYPYEIWHYYKIRTQRNRKFVFYNPDLITNDYELLHSDVNGEAKNPQWKVIIHGRNTNYQNLDENRIQDHYGGRADDYYNTPR